MKFSILTIAALIVAAGLWRCGDLAFAQTARLTSDASKSPTAAFPPVPAGIYQPPQPSVAIVWHTNVEPLTVRVTVSSNVVPVWRWVDGGVVYTNFAAPLSSNVISITTNEVNHGKDPK